MRISGFSSGLDIDSMVKELMKAQRSKYDKMVKNRTKVEWQQEDYRTMAAKIVDFRNNKLSNYSLSNTISAKTSTVSGDTNALTVDSTGSTAVGSLNVTVNQVAKSETQVYTFAAADKDKSLKDLGFPVVSATDTDNVKIEINGEAITLSKDAKLSDLAAAINSNSSKMKVTSLYSGVADSNNKVSFSITASQTGKGTDTIKFTDPSHAMAGTLDTAKGVEGKNAQITVNGIEYEQSTNKFTVSGYSFTVKAQSAANSSTAITATRDIDKMVETIKSFVNDYNSLISTVNGELSEKKYYSYAPLNSDEKDEMTDDDIKIWQDKARSGTLQNDSTLSQMVSELRLAATSLVAGVKDANGKSVSIGITTGGYSEKGKLVLDESKLRAALESNPDEVVQLFSAKSTDTSPNSTTSGVFAKMMDSSLDALKALSTKAGTSLSSADATASFLESSLLSEQIRNMKSRETLEQDRLDNMETQYYKTFTAMETAINKYNSQSSSLSSFS